MSVTPSPARPTLTSPLDSDPDQVIPPSPDASSGAAVDQSLVRGLAITGSVSFATQLLRWIVTLMIARILVPADYGLVGMALVYTGLVQLVNEFGLGTAIIQQRQLDERSTARIAGLALLLGGACFALSALLAGPVAVFFGEPAVRNIVVVLGFKFIIDSVGTVPRAVLSRNLRFGTLAVIDGTEAVVLSASSLALALNGAGYWALVVGALCGSVAATVVAARISPYRVAWPGSLRGIEESIRIGRDVVISRAAWFGYSNADFLVVGRLLDKTALGLYTVAWNIASIPVEKIAALVGRVMPGVFSVVQGDAASMRRYFLSLTEAIAFVTLPMSAGFVLAADELVTGLLGDQWLPTVRVLQILSLYTGIRSISTLPSHVMVMRGRADLARRCSLIAAAVLFVCFIVGSRWGINGVAAGWVVGYPVCIVLFDYRYVFRLLDLDASRLARAVWPAVSATAVMVIAVLVVRAALPADAAPLSRLAAIAATGTVVYAGVALVVHGRRVRAFVAVVRSTLFRSHQGG